jgi:adenine phosphoribosyltransferase
MVSDPGVSLLARHIRDVPDFPKPGILFKDITPLLADATAFRLSIQLLAERVAPLRPTMIVGVESRGFILRHLSLSGLDSALCRFASRASSPIVE